MEQRRRPRDQGEDQGDRDPGEPSPEPTFVPLSGDDVGVAGLTPRIDELMFEGGYLSPVEVNGLDRGLQSCPAVELGVVTATGIPPTSGARQVLDVHEPSLVLVDPAGEPGPPVEQRLVGDLDGRFACGWIAVGHEESCLHEAIGDRAHSRRQLAQPGTSTRVRLSLPGTTSRANKSLAHVWSLSERSRNTSSARRPTAPVMPPTASSAARPMTPSTRRS